MNSEKLKQMLDEADASPGYNTITLHVSHIYELLARIEYLEEKLAEVSE